MPKNYTLGTDSESDCYAIYDDEGQLIRGWQSGDDISRILRDVLLNLGVQLSQKSISVDGDYPSRI
jgi:hypothetical protein